MVGAIWLVCCNHNHESEQLSSLFVCLFVVLRLGSKASLTFWKNFENHAAPVVASFSLYGVCSPCVQCGELVCACVQCLLARVARTLATCSLGKFLRGVASPFVRAVARRRVQRTVFRGYGLYAR